MSNPYVCWSNQKFLAVNASQRIHSQQPGVTFLLYQVLPRHTPDVALRSACKPRGESGLRHLRARGSNKSC